MEMDRDNRIAMFVGAGLGAALMFMLDPGRGARRRALVKDKTARMLRLGGRAVRDRGHDIGNRLTGTVAEIRSRRSPPPADDQLIERVRAELGHHVEHAKAIEVVAEDGSVTLRGTVPSEQLDEVLNTVRSVNGVRDVRSEMEIQNSLAKPPSSES